jgi:O-antigen/teichoic acid export membrane protein
MTQRMAASRGSASEHAERGRPTIAALSMHTLAGRLVIFAGGLLSSVLIARALGPEGRGLYFLPIAIVTVVGTVSSQGVDLAQIRLWGRRAASTSEFMSAAAWLSAIVGGGVVAVCWIAYEAGRPGTSAQLPPEDLAIVLVLVPVWMHSVLLRGLLVIRGQITSVNRALVAGELCRTTGIAALYLADRLTVESVLALFGVSILVPWVLARVSLRDFVRAGQRRPWALMRHEVRLGSRLTPHVAFLMLNLRIDVLLVAHYLGLRELGVYSIAVLISELAWLPTWALSQPVKERQADRRIEEVVDITARTVRMTLVLAGLLGLALAVVAPVGVPLLFGSDFDPAVDAIWLLLPGSAMMAVWRPVSVALARLATPRVISIIGVTAVLVNVGANVVLIPAIGITGAALASTASYTLGALLALWAFVRVADVRTRDLVPRMSDAQRLLSALRPRAIRGQLAWLVRGGG